VRRSCVPSTIRVTAAWIAAPPVVSIHNQSAMVTLKWNRNIRNPQRRHPCAVCLFLKQQSFLPRVPIISVAPYENKRDFPLSAIRSHTSTVVLLPSPDSGAHPRGTQAAVPDRGIHIPPDFGAAFVPGAGPVQYAPKSLDHFQRGYEERAIQRDKEFYTERRREGRNAKGGDQKGTGRCSNFHNHTEDPWNQHRDRPTILQGLDINALADRLNPLLNNKAALFAELDRTREENRQVFDSGKALTALISVAARRKNIGLGHAAWDWMDRVGIAKNTFHYNSMISVAEKARDYQHALALLQEMKDRNIKKNEVTYVFRYFLFIKMLRGLTLSFLSPN
jgi:pentatricopeptide repeat protein